MTKRVLVTGYAKDTQTAHQISTLEQLGATVEVFTPMLAANGPPLAWSSERAALGELDLSLDAIDAVLVRSLPSEYPGAPDFNQTRDKTLDWPSWFQAFGQQRDRHDALFGLLLHIEALGIPMVNPPSRTIISRRKPYQLNTLRRLGCPVPDTLITNDPAAARRFINDYGQVIAKPAAGGALTLAANHIDDATLARLRNAPAILQQRIFGRDLRVIVLDGRVISCAAINVPKNTLDFRGDAGYQNGAISYNEIVLPDAVQDQCSRAAEALGLRFTGIDIKLTENNEYIFLECNSSPIYLDVERKLRHRITRELCLTLLQK